MSSSSRKQARGRPKTLDRDHVLNVAMNAYWSEGVRAVSLNEICRRSGASKPALYREFGGEDGLIEAALGHYYENVLAEVLQIFSGEIEYDKVLDLWIALSLDDSANKAYPPGCFFAALLKARRHLGPAAQSEVEKTQQKVLSIYERWFARGKESGEFTKSITSQRAARYLHAQLSNAMYERALGEAPEQIKDTLKLALSVLR